MKEVKVISLYAPWAVAIALGEKNIESRGWGTNYRGEIYIHATKVTPIEVIENIESNRLLKDIMKKYVGSPLASIKDLEILLPHSKIIAKANLVDCVKVDYSGLNGVILSNHIVISEKERQLGDYSAGRYAWILEDVVMLDKPIQAKGKQSIWTFDMEGVEQNGI